MYKILIAGIGVFACAAAFLGFAHSASAQEPTTDYPGMESLRDLDFSWIEALSETAVDPSTEPPTAPPPAAKLEAPARTAEVPVTTPASAGVVSLPAAGGGAPATRHGIAGSIAGALLAAGAVLVAVSGRTRRDTSGA